MRLISITIKDECKTEVEEKGTKYKLVDHANFKNVTCVVPKLEYDLSKGEQRLMSNEMEIFVTPDKCTNKVKTKNGNYIFYLYHPITYDVCIMVQNQEMLL